jgi:hypothetical protein
MNSDDLYRTARAIIQYRDDAERKLKPGLSALNGLEIYVECVAVESENAMYPGESEWMPDVTSHRRMVQVLDGSHPSHNGPPTWFASGDLKFVA